jgi:glycosyltransferase involved in cell wall biosynthesis
MTKRQQFHSGSARIGYVVKRYPRFSETFIVNEILAHELAGLDIEIFALRPSVDTHFQNVISQVRAPVRFLNPGSVKATEFWNECRKLGNRFPQLWPALSDARWATGADAYQAIQLVGEIHQRNIAHLHAHFATSAATVAQLAARIAGITYSVTMHAKDIFHESVEPEDLKSKIADAKFVVTVSEYNRKYLSENYGYADKIQRIYNGLDLDLFSFQSPFRRENKIITVGRLVHKKGICHLIDACRLLADKGVEFSCDIVGSGELETELANQIAALSLENQVRLIGPQPQNIVREMIRGAAVFAAPCVIGPDGNRDGLPTVITESLALGTPCISTDVTGIPEIIRHNQTGILVGQENPVELATQIERLFHDPELRNTLAQNARQLIEKEFDSHKNVARLRRLFPSTPNSQSEIARAAQMQGV